MTASSALLTLADAIVYELNNPAPWAILGVNYTAWSLAFTAARMNVPRFSLPQLSSLKVTVHPKDRVSTRATRNIMQDMMRIDIGLQVQIPNDTNAVTDPYVILGEQIQGYFDLKRPLQQLPSVVCQGSSFGNNADAPWLNPRNEQDSLLYAGIVILTFAVMRPGA